MNIWLDAIMSEVNKTDATDEQKLLVKELLGKTNIEKSIQSRVDSAVSKGVETNRQKMLDIDFPEMMNKQFEERYQERIKQDFPELNQTPEQKRIADLENKIKSMQAEADKKEKTLKLSALENKVRSELSLPAWINLNGMLDVDNETLSIEKVKAMKQAYDETMDKIKEQARQEVASKYNAGGSQKNTNGVENKNDNTPLTHEQALEKFRQSMAGGN